MAIPGHFLEWTLGQGKNNPPCLDEFFLILDQDIDFAATGFKAQYFPVFLNAQPRSIFSFVMQPLQKFPDDPAHSAANAAKRSRASDSFKPENYPLRSIQIFMHEVIVAAPIPDLDNGIVAQHITEYVPETQIPKRMTPEASVFPDVLEIGFSKILNPLQQFSFPVVTIKERAVLQVIPLLIGGIGKPWPWYSGIRVTSNCGSPAFAGSGLPFKNSVIFGRR